MRDTTISECKGYLTDSNVGTGGFGTYGNNEDFRFTICTSSPITLTFYGPFCLEAPSDSIRFFDGPSTSSPKIGLTYSGTSLPPSITALSGCLTIHFKSDNSVTYCGWTARWASVIIPPLAPSISVVSTPTCNTSSISLSLTSPVRCDSVKAKYFTINGPMGLMTPSVTLATAVGCVGNATSLINLTLSTPIIKNCTYTINSTVFKADNCDSVWKFMPITTFFMNGCSFTTSISVVGSKTICPSQCATLTCIPQSPCLTYSYAWSHGLPPTAGPHVVCPTTNTTYTVVATEIGGSGNTYTTTQLMQVINLSINPLPISITLNDTICQSVPPFNLSSPEPLGIWFGAGIKDSLTGLFNPDTAGAGTHYIKYKKGVCLDSIKIVVLPLNAGFNDAGCVGGGTFTVSGGLPAGGAWSGTSFITASGVFNPSTLGTYTITYTHPNGCSESKLVHINNLNVPLTVDSICQSVFFDSLIYKVSPPGGRFYGLGITDSVYGVFNPTLSGPGIKTITYKLGNCQSTFSLFVKQIYIPRWISTCPFQPIITMSTPIPTGGFWSGIGITNTLTGSFDPGFKGTATRVDTVFYTAPNGCKDTTYIYCVKTNMTKDTLYFCETDDSLALKMPTFLHTPEGGIFTGAGIIHPTTTYYFKPKLAGVGVHTINYLINTCQDSIKMIVYPNKLTAGDSTICLTHPPFVIENLPPNTVWHGTGVNSTTGLFSPLTAGTGTFNIYYTTPVGCSDTVQIIVYPFQNAHIAGLTNNYCFKDTNYVFALTPAVGGTLTGLGITGTTFNPKNAGAGTFYIKYTFGKGICYTADSAKITVYPKIQTTLSVSKDTICKGGSSTISITPSGGFPGAIFTYQWNNGLFPLGSNVVVPTANTWYVIKTSDGCSTPKIDSVFIIINTPYNVAINTNSLLCYGDVGFASTNITPAGTYSYLWNTAPTQTTSGITNCIAGKSYLLKIKNLLTGCTYDTLVKIPSYPPIKALFSPNPNLSCVPFDDKDISFLDLCNGADSGYWNFDGTLVPYVTGQTPHFDFTNSGNHSVSLTVFNKGNCVDVYAMQICILESTELYIPDIFSPNGDGQNDVFYIRGKGIKDLYLSIYNRWGEKVFETKDITIGWDGTYKGSSADLAVYVYYLEVTMISDKKITKKGNVTLIR